MRPIPPLNPLRTFAVAAQSESFASAAQELHVTPGAISRQIQVLEDYLGVALFDRSNRSVRLTDAGRHYLLNLDGVFGQIENATRSVSEKHRSKALRIWSSMTFTLRWLMPRLPYFHAEHPNSEVVFSTSLKPVELGMSDADIAIRIGTGEWPGLVCERLMSIELLPVCSPALLKGKNALRKPDDLQHHNLLHSSIQPDHWPEWLAFSGANAVQARRGMMFESVSLAYEAAIGGVGVAMGQLALVADDLEKGRLVAPFKTVMPAKSSFYLIYPSRLEQSRLLQDFRLWVRAQAQDDQRARAQRFGLPHEPPTL